jgi:hypothetical protein
MVIKATLAQAAIDAIGKIDTAAKAASESAAA